MATKKVINRNQNAYIHGSAVPKPELPKRQSPERQKPDRQKQPRISHTVRRNQERALHMDFPYVCALTLAAVCTLYLCVSYLHLQSSITSRIHNIESLEKKLETLRSENNALETRINTSIDLDHIYQVATTELGMVYANKNQVILYNKTESEYVRQYEDIPKH